MLDDSDFKGKKLKVELVRFPFISGKKLVLFYCYCFLILFLIFVLKCIFIYPNNMIT